MVDGNNRLGGSNYVSINYGNVPAVMKNGVG